MTNKGIILYQSKYGSTKRYAQWLQEITGFDLIETKKADIKKVMNYNMIILGGGVYASGILGFSFIKKNIDTLKNKKIVVFCVGASPYDEKAYNQVKEMHFKNKLKDIPLFYCRGAWDMENMSMIDRNLCKMLQKAVSRQNPDTYEPWQKALMCVGKDKCDWTDKEYLNPLIKYIEENSL